MDKERILAEIRRTALENGGVALGQERFTSATGIAQHEWRGKHWRRWSEAIEEAGLTANRRNEAFDRDLLIERLVMLTAKLGRFPTYADHLMERQGDKTLPNHNAFKRLGSLEERIALVRAYVAAHREHRSVLSLLPSDDASDSDGGEAATPGSVDGAVYMLKLGKHFKVGKSFRVPQRHREIAIELPEKPDIVHVITTDDPTGIEAYWHKRFADRRTNGEWFALSKDDVRAFKRRKFM